MSDKSSRVRRALFGPQPFWALLFPFLSSQFFFFLFALFVPMFLAFHVFLNCPGIFHFANLLIFIPKHEESRPYPIPIRKASNAKKEGPKNPRRKAKPSHKRRPKTPTPAKNTQSQPQTQEESPMANSNGERPTPTPRKEAQLSSEKEANLHPREGIANPIVRRTASPCLRGK